MNNTTTQDQSQLQVVSVSLMSIVIGLHFLQMLVTYLSIKYHFTGALATANGFLGEFISAYNALNNKDGYTAPQGTPKLSSD